MKKLLYLLYTLCVCSLNGTDEYTTPQKISTKRAVRPYVIQTRGPLFAPLSVKQNTQLIPQGPLSPNTLIKGTLSFEQEQQEILRQAHEQAEIDYQEAELEKSQQEAEQAGQHYEQVIYEQSWPYKQELFEQKLLAEALKLFAEKEKSPILERFRKLKKQREERKTGFHPNKRLLHNQDDFTHLPRPALHKAVREGNIEKVRDLLDKGLDINEQDCDKKTPLHYAVKSLYPNSLAINPNAVPIAKLLVAKGTNKSIKDVNEKTAEQIAQDQYLFFLRWHKQLCIPKKTTLSDENLVGWETKSEQEERELLSKMCAINRFRYAQRKAQRNIPSSVEHAWVLKNLDQLRTLKALVRRDIRDYFPKKSGAKKHPLIHDNQSSESSKRHKP